MAQIDDVLDKNWQALKALPNVINVAIGTKNINGQNIGIQSITVYVGKKLPASVLPVANVVPKVIDGIVTDVIELSHPTWTAGETEISKLHPAEQLKRLGHDGPPIMIADNPFINIKPKATAFNQSSDLKIWASPIQNQGSCGECVGYGAIGAVEGKYRIQINNPTDQIKLSEDNAFFCAGGTCGNGMQVTDILNYLLANPVCSETCQPSKNRDIACNIGRCDNWWVDAKKLDKWIAITDIATMKSTLDSQPLIAVMAVHQSFFNYKSGVYHSLPTGDPIVGYHCFSFWGHDEPLQAWKSGRNSWGINWGENGYFNIAYGDSMVDTFAMYQVEVDLTPIPAPPGPNPNPNPNPKPNNGCMPGSAQIAAIKDGGMSKLSALFNSKAISWNIVALLAWQYIISHNMIPASWGNYGGLLIVIVNAIINMLQGQNVAALKTKVSELTARLQR